MIWRARFAPKMTKAYFELTLVRRSSIGGLVMPSGAGAEDACSGSNSVGMLTHYLQMRQMPVTEVGVTAVGVRMFTERSIASRLSTPLRRAARCR